VIHIQTTATVSGLGGDSIDVYYTKGVGEIETVDPSDSKTESLTDYEIK
jgi:hypothetical protein